MGSTAVEPSLHDLLDGHHLNPFQDMTDLEPIRLNPPPTRKWVKFTDWDEEALEYTMQRRHSAQDTLSSSVSSETSLGSAGEGSGKSRLLASMDEPAGPKALAFNASFGGYTQNGDPAAIRSVFKPPKRSASIQVPRALSAEVAASPPVRFSAFKEVDETQEEEAEQQTVGQRRDSTSDESSRYSAFDGVRREGVYLGWSNNVLGTEYGWSENIKTAEAQRPGSLHLLSAEARSEADPSPEAPGALRLSSWPRSPGRSFVRNFP